MKRFGLAVTLIALLATALQAREWSDASGQNKVEAEFVGIKDGNVVLRKPDGKLATVPLSKLSAEDQTFVQAQPSFSAPQAAQPEAAPAAEGEKDRFTQAIEKNPNDPTAYYSRGMAKLNRQNYSEAMQDFDKALQLNPKFAAAYDGRGTALSRSGKPLDAQVNFDKAIEMDPELASAYRNRADNIKALWDSPQGKEILKERSQDYRKKYEAARSSSLQKTPWQPLNTTAGNMVADALKQMQQVDYDMALQLEGRYGVGGVGGDGISIGGGGLTISNGGVKIVGGGLSYIQPGTTIVGNPPLAVYPEEVVVGQTITLVANPAELSKAMPVQLGPNGKPIRAPRGAYGQGPPREPVYGVDFYRDVDGDGLLNGDTDDYLATDSNSKDGFSVEVSTAGFTPGNTAYFAVGRGQQPAGVPATFSQAAEAIKKQAATEREIAEASEGASNGGGYTTEQAQKLRGDQKRIAENAQKMASAFQQTAPEAAGLLAKAFTPMKAVDTRLDAGEKRPGEASVAGAKSAAQKAAEAANYLDQAYAKLAERAQGEEEGEGSPSPASPAGAAAIASGKVNPAGGKPAPPAPATGGPDYAGNDNGGDDNDDGDDVVRVDDDDDDVVVVRDDDDDNDRLVVIDEDDDVEVRDTINKALTYVDDDDYDHAIEVYDDYLVEKPDDAKVLIHRADAYVNDGSYDYAIRDYDRLVKLGVERADLFYNLGCAHLAAGEIDLAIVNFNKSIDLDETRNLAYTNRGTAYARSGDFERAIVDFNSALRLDARDQLALRNRALAYKRLGQLDKADADLVRIRELQAVVVE